MHGNQNSSFSVDPREQFGTHENLSWGVHGGPHWPPAYKPLDVYHCPQAANYCAIEYYVHITCVVAWTYNKDFIIPQ